jgi:predicted acyl esterase
MIPMRDGVKLKTFILIPKARSSADADDAHALRRRDRSCASTAALIAPWPQMDDTAVQAGYIIVFQDVRGKYGSEGDYVMTRRCRALRTHARSITRPTATTRSTGW